ncbi:DNA-3-methyladenine glycosylase II [Amycolatopsis arida]|uniref:DNA-3-methyladenine glycosylase II n=1 Tax=Amycolatopsis arida TaxID=587909 RepID=A0A1I5PCW7_9PSEU|nr:DNA-3-methyladenine glycosylase 2 family protein [Amycolatopsis arida]TDX98455.1 DNA-3-methyladenine glycosylase II [Amycolatopsis arida]SFP31974.1 DNA-3-methyladenine glycosylase II [Amycolatopsis arida]
MTAPLTEHAGIVTDVTARGPFDLAASAGFLDDVPPPARDPAVDGLALAFPVDGRWVPAGVLVRQRAPGPVRIEVSAPPDVVPAATVQAGRILSLDVDGGDFAAVAEADPVLDGLYRRWPGMRPVLFASPYEAACWAIMANRMGGGYATAVKQRIARRHGPRVRVGTAVLCAFPAPGVLAEVDGVAGLPERKVEWLRAIALAARSGELDAERLRGMEAEEALWRLRQLPGVGPHSAQLVLGRGAGHPDVFPRDDWRLRVAMARRYGVGPADVPALERLAERWRPYRGWAAHLVRLADDTPEPVGPTARGGG